jgi:hypothetical protein
VPGIHVFRHVGKQGVDGRDKPGHDGCKLPRPYQRDRLILAEQIEQLPQRLAARARQ